MNTRMIIYHIERRLSKGEKRRLKAINGQTPLSRNGGPAVKKRKYVAQLYEKLLWSQSATH